MSTITGTYRKRTNVRMRPMDEWHGSLAYTPDNPNIFYLNRTLWIIAELCEGQTRDELCEQFVNFVSEVVDASEAKHSFDEGLAMLEEKGIVELVA